MNARKHAVKTGRHKAGTQPAQAVAGRRHVMRLSAYLVGVVRDLNPSRPSGLDRVAELLEVDRLQGGHHVLQHEHRVHKVVQPASDRREQVGRRRDKLDGAVGASLRPLGLCPHAVCLSAQRSRTA